MAKLTAPVFAVAVVINIPKFFETELVDVSINESIVSVKFVTIKQIFVPCICYFLLGGYNKNFYSCYLQGSEVPYALSEIS